MELLVFSRAPAGQASAMSVRNGPAEIVFTRTVGPNSLENAVVSAFRAALEAAYVPKSGSGQSAPDDDTLMIEPPSPATMRWPTSAESRKGPLKLTPTTLSNSSSEVSADDGARGDMPALFRSTSKRPNPAYAASTSASMSAQRPTWQPTASARRPISSPSGATASQASTLRLVITTSAPARAKADRKST